MNVKFFRAILKNCLVRLHGEVTKPNMPCRKRSLCKNETLLVGKIERFKKIYIQEI